MTESKVSVAQRELLDVQKLQTMMLMAKEVVNIVVEQGLWVALMVNMGAICQRVEQGTFVSRQRTQIIDVVRTLTKKSLVDDIFGIGGIPNPGYYMFGILKPLLKELEKTELDDNGVKYYSKVDPIPMMVLVFEFPGLLKLLSSQLGEIVPG